MKVLFLLCLLLPVGFSFQQKAKPLAYLYSGPGLCRLCTSSAINRMQEIGFEVKQIRPGEITAGELKNADLFVIPGGDDLYRAAFAFQEGEIEAIQGYVKNGGRFLGICLGAYLADSLLVYDRTVPGLSLFDGVVSPHDLDETPRIEKVKWGNTERMMYFQEGPDFAIAAKAKADIFATYSDGKVAALQMNVGKGRIGLIGPHPEADERWLKEDHVEDPDGDDSFLLTEFVHKLMQ